MKIYDVSRLPSQIVIGHGGENDWLPIHFDCSALLENHPDGVITLWLTPNGATEAYPVALEREWNVVTWTPKNSELTASFGRYQLRCQDGDAVGESDTVNYKVKESLAPGAEHPAETPSWAVQVVSDVTNAASKYPHIGENGNWYVWDATQQKWVDTGVAAGGGDIDPEDIAEAVENYFDEHPITETDPTVPTWAKNPTKPTYTAAEVHALPDSTAIPTKTSDLQNDSGFLTQHQSLSAYRTASAQDSIDAAQDAAIGAKYSKPSGGIPASDLAADMPFFTLPEGGQIGQALLSDGNGGAVWGEAGIPEAVKTALLACFRNVAWVNDDGQTYYDALYAALHNEPAPPSPVPNEYQRVEWVGTQNSSIAYILTGISESGMAALAGYSIHLTAAFGVSQPSGGIDTNGSVIVFSSKAGTYFGSLKTGRVAIGTSETYALPSSVVCTNKNDYIAEYSNTGLTISSNNQSVSRNYSTSGDTAQELTIGTGSISADNVAEWSQFYSVKVYKNETLVADFFPVYRIADGVIGFYDAVRNRFYTNSGSGSFVKGGDIA